MNFDDYTKDDFINLMRFWIDCRNHFLKNNDKQNADLCNCIASYIERKMLEVIE